jgi:hypothetical protein
MEWKSGDNWQLLVGVSGFVYQLSDDLGFTRTRGGFVSIGCGARVADAVMSTALRLGKHPMVCLRMALEEAERADACVRKPFRILEL